jgi:gas vesicle protein
MSAGKVFFSIVTGMAAGTILGLLFAPAKGSYALGKKSTKSEEFTEAMEEKFDEFLDRLSEKLKN